MYLKRLYYDTVTFNPYNLHLLRDEVGTDHMLMGSDYPHLLGSIDRAVSSIDGLDIPGSGQAGDLQRYGAPYPEQRVTWRTARRRVCFAWWASPG